MSDRDGWFDGRGLDLLREGFLDHHEGWKKYIEDSQITAEEILEQENRIIHMLRELEPTWSMQMLERLDGVALESSNGWNNAGTGHSALAELNYTPEDANGNIKIAQAINIKCFT